MILGEEPVTLRTSAAGSRDSLGNWVPGSTTDSTILMSFQPLGEADRRELESSGYRERVLRKGYTTSTVKTVDQYSGVSADRIVVDGVVYVCLGAARQRSIIPHYKVWLGRLDEGAT